VNNCAGCEYYQVGVTRIFKSSRITEYFYDDHAKGRCNFGVMEGKEVPASFGCVDWKERVGPAIHPIAYGDKEMWDVWEMIPCPPCRGKGCDVENPNAPGCGFCAGTGNVRKYADGEIVSERIREHPVRVAEMRKQAEAEILARAHADIERIENPPEPEKQEERLPFA
jgi:hypothetical protein